MNGILHIRSLAAVLSVGLALSAGPASAAVEVRFVGVEKYSDVGEFEHLRSRDEALHAIKAHLTALGDKYLPGKEFVVEVTDVDLAGAVEPVGRRMEMLRVLRSTGRPAMELRYVLRESGREVRSGQARLSDLAYQHGFNRYSESDPMRYEKRMIDEWFGAEFLPAGQRVGRIAP